MATQRTELQLATSGGAKVKQDLEAVGAAGERAFKRVRDAAKDVPTHLRAVDAAAADVRKRTQSLASELGPLGSALKAIGPLAATGGAAFVALATGFTVLAKRAIDSASALRDQADRVGINVEKLQELGVAGRQVGVSSELLGTSLEKLTANLGKARDGSGTLAKYLKTTDSAFLSTLQHATDTGKAFDLLVGFIAKLPTEADKAAAAVAAFGKAGVQLLPLLNEGPKGLAAMAAEARRLGIILDERLINQADDAGDKLQLLSEVVQGNLNRALLSVAPQIAAIAEELAKAAAAGARFAASIGIGQLSPAQRLEDIKRQLRDISKAPAWSLGDLSGQGTGLTDAQRQQRTAALKAEALAIREQMEAADKAEQKRLATRQAGVEALIKQQEEEAAAEDARKKAASDADAAEKRHLSQRKQALEEIKRLQDDAAKAGLDGIALVEKERDQAYAHFAELAKQGLLTEQEAADAYLAAWQEAEGKKAKIVEDANEKAAKKQQAAADKAADQLSKPFENALENVQREFGNTFRDILTDGKVSFQTLADDALSIFTDLAVEIVNAFVAQQFFQPLIDQVKGIPSQLPAAQGGTAGGVRGGGVGSVVSTVGSGIETIGSLAKALGLGGAAGSSLGSLIQGAGGILGLVNAFAGKGGVFGRTVSGVLGANALANTAGLGVSIIPTTSGALAIQVAGNTLLTVGASGLALGSGVSTAAGAASLYSPTQAAFLGLSGATTAGATASSALGVVSAVAPYIAAAVATYVGIQSQVSASKTLARPNPQLDVGTLGWISPVQSVPYLLGKGSKGSSALAVQEILDPFTASLLSQTIGRIPAFGNLINPEPSYQDIKPQLFRAVAQALNTHLGVGGGVFGPTAGLGARGRAAARGFRGTDVAFLLDLTSQALAEGITRAPGSPQARQEPADVLRTLRDVLKGGAARTAASGGDPVTLLGKLVRELFDMGTALTATNALFLKRNSTELQAGKTAEGFTAAIATIVDVFANRLPKGIDATRVAAKVLEDQGYATKRAIQRAGLIESRNRAEREGTLLLDPAADDTVGGRTRLRNLRRRARAGLFGAQDVALGAVDQVQREIALVRGGPAVGAAQAFGNIQSALDAINLARKAKDFEALGQAVTGAVDAVRAWGQTVVNLVDQIRALDRQLEDFKLTSAEETDALRKGTNTGALYNDVLAANAAKFARLIRDGGSAAAQLDVVNRQLDLLRRQAAAQRTDIQERLAAELKPLEARATAVTPLAGLAESARAQLDALLVGSKSTPVAQLAEVQAQLLRTQGQFRTATGEDQAAAARRVLDLVNQTLAVGGAALGPASQRFLGVRRAALGAAGEVTAAAEASQRELVDLIARSTAANEQAAADLDAIDTTLAAQLDTWNAKIVPLLEAQRNGLVDALMAALPGADIEALLADPQAAQLLVANRQLDELKLIKDAINGLVSTAQGRGGVTVNVTVAAPTTGSTAQAALYGRTAGDAIGARIALALADQKVRKRA